MNSSYCCFALNSLDLEMLPSSALLRGINQLLLIISTCVSARVSFFFTKTSLYHLSRVFRLLSVEFQLMTHFFSPSLKSFSLDCYGIFSCCCPNLQLKCATAVLVENGKFLLSAKRNRRTTCTEYIITMDADNISRSSSTYIGKLRY